MPHTLAGMRRLSGPKTSVIQERLTWSDKMIYGICGAVALGLLVYLFMALLRPEKF
jgi:K+-transporting ATPase KdpF subunit